MAERLFGERTRLHAQAWFVGERIDAGALERGEALGLGPLTVRAGRRGCAVVFRWGAVVLYDLEPAEAAALLETLDPLITGRFDDPEHEESEIVLEPAAAEGVDADGTVRLRAANVERLQIVAMVLAKSAVLSHYEHRVGQVFDRIEPLAQRLRHHGRGYARARGLRQHIGDVLLIQSRMVGRFELDEKPELTWDRPDLDRLYERLGVEYELRERDLALERKLELISRAAETLLELLQNRRMLRAGWYIVILIAIGIVLFVYDIFPGH